MAECDQHIQRGSSTELTQLVKERQVQLQYAFRNEKWSFYPEDITVLPDQKLVALGKREDDKTGREFYVAVFRKTDFKCTRATSINVSELDHTLKKALIMGLGSDTVMTTFILTDKKAGLPSTTFEMTRFVFENDRFKETGDKSRKTITKSVSGVACANTDTLFAIFMLTSPPEMEVGNLTTGVFEHVQIQGFDTQFMSASGEPFIALDESEGQGHLFVSVKVGLGTRVVTKLNLKGEILATLMDPANLMSPGPIAAVGDGSLLFNYGDSICLLSNNCKIRATMKPAESNIRAMCVGPKTKQDVMLYCLGEGPMLTEYLCTPSNNSKTEK